MRDDEIIQRLDEVEAELRGLECSLYGIRSRLRQRVDPHKRRKDLGHWRDDQDHDVDAQEAAAVHRLLDEMGIARTSDSGEVYSLKGRVQEALYQEYEKDRR